MVQNFLIEIEEGTSLNTVLNIMSIELYRKKLYRRIEIVFFLFSQFHAESTFNRYTHNCNNCDALFYI